MKHWVSVAVEGRVYVEVDAESFEDAKTKACAKICDMDFGELECVEWDAVNAESEDGEEIDY